MRILDWVIQNKGYKVFISCFKSVFFWGFTLVFLSSWHFGSDHMVSAFIFFLHFVMAVYAFIQYKKESIGAGISCNRICRNCFLLSVGQLPQCWRTYCSHSSGSSVGTGSRWIHDVASSEKGDQPRYNFASDSYQRRGCISTIYFFLQNQKSPRRKSDSSSDRNYLAWSKM